MKCNALFGTEVHSKMAILRIVPTEKIAIGLFSRDKELLKTVEGFYLLSVRPGSHILLQNWGEEVRPKLCCNCPFQPV